MKNTYVLFASVLLSISLLVSCTNIPESSSVSNFIPSSSSALANSSSAKVTILPKIKSKPQTTDTTSSQNSCQGPDLPDYSSPQFTYKSDLVGWVVFPWHDSMQADLYETTDGGETWKPSQVNILPEMLEGAPSIFTWSVYQEGNQWKFALLAKKEYGYFGQCFYEFVLDETTNTWNWDNPQWLLPSSVNPLHFKDYVCDQILFAPPEYNYKDGLTTNYSIIKLIYDTAQYNNRLGKNKAGVHVTFEQINQMAALVYGDTSFDIKTFIPEIAPPFSPNENSFSFSLDASDAFYNFVEGAEVFILETSCIDSNTIEVYTVTIPLSYEDNTADYLYRRCVFTPISYEGIDLFTMLSSEEVNGSRFAGKVPDSHWTG